MCTFFSSKSPCLFSFSVSLSGPHNGPDLLSHGIVKFLMKACLMKLMALTRQRFPRLSPRCRLISSRFVESTHVLTPPQPGNSIGLQNFKEHIFFEQGMLQHMSCLATIAIIAHERHPNDQLNVECSKVARYS